jgi:hypothetical protein
MNIAVTDVALTIDAEHHTTAETGSGIANSVIAPAVTALRSEGDPGLFDAEDRQCRPVGVRRRGW